MNNELYHHGIKGQRWGVRRYQNEDGSYTAAGKERYSGNEREGVSSKKGLSDKTKKTIKTVATVGAVAAGTALAAYGAYKLTEAVKNENLALINQQAEKAFRTTFMEESRRTNSLREEDIIKMHTAKNNKRQAEDAGDFRQAEKYLHDSRTSRDFLDCIDDVIMIRSTNAYNNALNDPSKGNLRLAAQNVYRDYKKNKGFYNRPSKRGAIPLSDLSSNARKTLERSREW